MHSVRVHGPGHHHRLLRGDGHGGAPSQRGQDAAGSAAGGHRKLLPHHLHRGARHEDFGLGICAAPLFLPKVGEGRGRRRKTRQGSNVSGKPYPGSLQGLNSSYVDIVKRQVPPSQLYSWNTFANYFFSGNH